MQAGVVTCKDKLTGIIDVIRCKIHKSRELAAFFDILNSGLDVNRCEIYEYGDLLCIMALIPWRDQNIGKCRIHVKITCARLNRSV